MSAPAETVSLPLLGEEGSAAVRLRRGPLSLVSLCLRWQRVRASQPVVPKLNKAAMEYSTRKLRPQKRTGKPPIGSRSSTQLRHGALCHGPMARARVMKVNRRERALALESLILSRFADRGRCLVARRLPTAATTSSYLAEALALGVGRSARVLYALSPGQEAPRGLANVPGHDAIPASALNCRSMMSHDLLVLSEGALGAWRAQG